MKVYKLYDLYCSTTLAVYTTKRSAKAHVNRLKKCSIEEFPEDRFEITTLSVQRRVVDDLEQLTLNYAEVE